MALVLALSLSLAPAALAEGGMANFKKTRDYPGFSDVKSDAWYYNDLKDAYEMGLINGNGEGTFDPDGNLTRAQAITMAVNLSAIYYGDSFTPGGSPWYQNAVDFAIEAGILLEDEFDDYTAEATRAEMAGLFAYTIADEEYARINKIAWIPDVNEGTKYVDAIYLLYASGILTGGEGGAFRPQEHIKRSEAVCILARLANPGKRVSFSLDDPMPNGTVLSAADGSYQVSIPSGWKVQENKAENGNSHLYTFAGKGETAVQVDSFDKTQRDTDMEKTSAAWQDVLQNPETWNASVSRETERILRREFSALRTIYTYQQDGLDFVRTVYVYETDRYVYSIQLLHCNESADEDWEQACNMFYSVVAAL